MRNFYYVTTAAGTTLKRCDSQAEAEEAALRHPNAEVPAGVRVTDMWGNELARFALGQRVELGA